jgi:hypothetical protein
LLQIEQYEYIYTELVRLWVDVPVMAGLVMLPLKMELMVLMKLDFPDPTSPINRIFAIGISVSSAGV